MIQGHAGRTHSIAGKDPRTLDFEGPAIGVNRDSVSGGIGSIGTREYVVGRSENSLLFAVKTRVQPPLPTPEEIMQPTRIVIGYDNKLGSAKDLALLAGHVASPLLISSLR